MLLKNEDFRLWHEQTLARIAELRKDKGRATKQLTDSWLNESAEEQRETLQILVKALNEEHGDERTQEGT